MILRYFSESSDKLLAKIKKDMDGNSFCFNSLLVFAKTE